MERNPNLIVNMKQVRKGKGERLQQDGWELDPR